MIFPVKLEIEAHRVPVSNYLLILITIFFFFFTISDTNAELFENMVLKDFNPVGLLGNIFLHADIFHLIGNMLFLFVFGSAVCVVFGNIIYPLAYLLLGVLASVIHLLVDGNPAIGASGAISGLMGLVLVWFPKEKIKFLYFFLAFGGGVFRLSVIYAVLFYFVMDIIGAIGGGTNVAHFAHIGGLFAGMLTGLALQKLNVVYFVEITLIDIVSGNKKAGENRIVNDILDEANDLKLDNEISGMNFTPEYDVANQPVLNEFIDPVFQSEIVEPETQPVLQETLQEAIPKFRALRIIKNENEVKCFIVNEGDTIKNVSAESVDGIKCEILPAKEFKSNDSGILKFTNSSSSRIKIFISYDNLNGTDQTELIYDPDLNKVLFAEVVT